MQIRARKWDTRLATAKRETREMRGARAKQRLHADYQLS